MILYDKIFYALLNEGKADSIVTVDGSEFKIIIDNIEVYIDDQIEKLKKENNLI